MASMKDTQPPRGKRRRRRSPWTNAFRSVRQGTQNAVELMRLGRLGGDNRAEFQVVHSEAMYRLRRYDGAEGGVPIVLVPPLMLTAEIYDVAPDLSAVAALVRRGVDPWVIDFGAPEREAGGMERTLD